MKRREEKKREEKRRQSIKVLNFKNPPGIRN